MRRSIRTPCSPYVNPHMLYSKHLGLRGSYWKLKESGDAKLAELEQVIDRIRRSGWIKPEAMYRYFEAYSEGNSVHVAQDGRPAATVRLSAAGDGRAALPRGLRPAAWGRGPLDTVALLLTRRARESAPAPTRSSTRGNTCSATRSRPSRWKPRRARPSGSTRSSRERWGLPDPPSTTMMDRFQARYTGKAIARAIPRGRTSATRRRSSGSSTAAGSGSS